ncbi:MAG: hypothetical protein Kow0010_15690 [Dehalococcoidia bacterium]
MVLRGALAMVVTFVVALAAIEIADVAPGDARLRAAVVVALWAVTPTATALAVTRPAVSLRRWAPVALGASAAWASAAGLSAAYLDGALTGPDVAVFAGTFGFLFVPLALIVLLVAIVVRLRHLMVRIRDAATTEA